MCGAGTCTDNQSCSLLLKTVFLRSAWQPVSRTCGCPLATVLLAHLQTGSCCCCSARCRRCCRQHPEGWTWRQGQAHRHGCHHPTQGSSSSRRRSSTSLAATGAVCLPVLSCWQHMVCADTEGSASSTKRPQAKAASTHCHKGSHYRLADDTLTRPRKQPVPCVHGQRPMHSCRATTGNTSDIDGAHKHDTDTMQEQQHVLRGLAAAVALPRSRPSYCCT